MEPNNLKEKIEIFAREILGCGCPDEVFEYIDTKSTEKGYFRINIGNRLLIYLFVKISNSTFQDLKSFKEQYLKAGVNERNELGFNRFRLVFSIEYETFMTEQEQHEFTKCDYEFCDEKTHVHVVDSKRIESLDLFSI